MRINKQKFIDIVVKLEEKGLINQGQNTAKIKHMSYKEMRARIKELANKIKQNEYN